MFSRRMSCIKFPLDLKRSNRSTHSPPCSLVRPSRTRASPYTDQRATIQMAVCPVFSRYASANTLQRRANLPERTVLQELGGRSLRKPTAGIRTAALLPVRPLRLPCSRAASRLNDTFLDLYRVRHKLEQERIRRSG